MKNLFSINKTDSKEANDFDENPYLTARVSEEVRAKMKSAFSVVEDEVTPHEPTEEEKALKKQGNRYWLICFGCFVGAFALLIGGTHAGLYASMPYLHVLDAGLLIASVIFNFKARKINRKQTALDNGNLQFDLTEASRQLEAAAAEAARELGVPEQALSVDILPFHYKLKDDTVLPAGKKGRFDNISVSMYTKDGDLCLATAQELFCIPLSDIRGYREYDEDFEIDMWLKPEEFDSAKYKEYGIRKSGFLARKGHGYFGLEICGAQGDFEVLIPCYDFPLVQGLIAPQRLDSRG